MATLSIVAAATATKSQDLRLQCLQSLCTDVARGINTALHALRNGAEDAEIAYLVCDALERVGYMAERTADIAHGPGGKAGICGGADDWVFSPLSNNALCQLEAAERAEVAQS